MAAKIKGLHLALCILMILYVLVFAGCTTVENDGLPSPQLGIDITISTGTQGSVRQLAIGLADTGREEYTDASGKTRHRLVAGLHLCVYGNPPVEESMSVHVGQTVEFQNYTLYVKEISAGGIACAPGGSTGHVRLIVGYTTAEKAEPHSLIGGMEITISTGTQDKIRRLYLHSR